MLYPSGDLQIGSLRLKSPLSKPILSTHMELIRDLFKARQTSRSPVISVEFFPPKTEEGEKNLIEKTVPALKKGPIDFCSVTYGAGGSTREKTLSLAQRIQTQHQWTTLAHLTCVNHTQAEVIDILKQASTLGIRNVLALRGDPPGGGEFQKTPGGFEYASELVACIRQQGNFSIGVAGFPEGHLACKEGPEADWKHLVGKISAGADFVLTQLFFDNQDYFKFVAFLKRHNVNIPIVPGIIPIQSGAQIKRFTSLCGAKLPPALIQSLDALPNDEEAAVEFGIEYATRQCRELLDAGAPGIHFYTLNKSRSTLAVLEKLGLFKPASKA